MVRVCCATLSSTRTVGHHPVLYPILVYPRTVASNILYGTISRYDNCKVKSTLTFCAKSRFHPSTSPSNLSKPSKDFSGRQHRLPYLAGSERAGSCPLQDTCPQNQHSKNQYLYITVPHEQYMPLTVDPFLMRAVELSPYLRENGRKRAGRQLPTDYVSATYKGKWGGCVDVGGRPFYTVNANCNVTVLLSRKEHSLQSCNSVDQV